MGRVLAAYGGGFKPPTRGHFEIVKTALNDFPEIDEFYIYVGGKVRDGIDQFEAIQIWDIYKKYLANKVDIQPSKSPIGDILRLAKDNPQDIIYFVIGYREGRQDDLDDVSARTDNLKEKYPNIIVKVIPTYDPNMSGTNARKVLDNEEEFVKFLPYEVEEKSEVFKLVQKLDEMSIPKFDVVKPIIDQFLGGAEKAGRKLLEIVKREGKQTLVLVKEIAEYVISGEKPNEAEQKKINKQLLDLGFLALLGITGNIPVSIFGILYWILQESGVAKEFLKLDEIALIEEWLNEADPKKGTGKKPKGSSRRLYTDEDPKDTVGVKFSTRQDIVDTLGKASFKAKSHARQSQIINLIHQRVRAALARTKDPDKKKKLKAGFEYIKGKKEASKKKTQRLKKQKKENVAPNHDGKAAPFGSGYDKVKERKGFGGRSRYRAIEKRGDKYYYIQDNPFSPGIRQEFGPYKTKEQAKKKMNSFPPSTNYRDINEGKYDSLVTKLAGFTLNAWKGDFEDGQNKGLIEVEVGPGLDFDYPHLKFIYKAEAKFGGFYRTAGAAIPDPPKGLPRVRLNYNIPIDELPRMWERISMDIRNTIRHEIEHLMQSGPNVKKGKEKASDRSEREELATGKKPWWKFWRKTLGTPEYYKLEKEIDANLEGLYLKAKKSRQPLEQVIDNYLQYDLNLPIEDREDIKALWKKRAPELNIPLEEGDTYEKMAAKGKKAGKLKQGTVRKRLNIPKGKKIPLSKINKELSRLKKMDKDKDKKGVQLGDKNQKYYKALQLAKTLKTTTNLNEVLNPATFDYKPIIASLTKSMEKDGLNLQPYPTVRFIHDEEANADDFFGKTAYYDPNNKEVVLYTLGRHPKDIMRSYAHELIHVHQDNEDRLHNVQTTDVNADEYLEQLEREAYETGNIMFRSWTNSITEGKKKVKDPFGLNAFARELATLREDETIEEPNIYLDMDGVVADFDKRFEDLSGMLPQAYVDKHGLNAFWDLIDEKHKVAFWRGIELMPGAVELVKFVSQYPYQMLTAPSVKKQSVIGKGLWVKDKVGTLYPSKPKVFYRKAKEKHMVKPELTKNDILIDDRADTIGRWAGAGGTAILYQSANQVINDLKKLGL